MNADGRRLLLLDELGAACSRLSAVDVKYAKGANVFRQAEQAEYVYQVVDGAVRTHKLLRDDRRQIGGFHLVGDIFGLESGETHRFTAEAIVQTTLRRVSRSNFDNF